MQVKIDPRELKKLHDATWSGHHMRVWLAYTGYTQSQAAEAIGVSRPSMRRYLSGEHAPGRTVTLACKAVMLMLQQR